MLDFDKEASFHNEFLPLTYLKHENIVKLFGWTKVSRSKPTKMVHSYGILMEYMEGESLNEGKSNSQGFISKAHCFSILNSNSR